MARGCGSPLSGGNSARANPAAAPFTNGAAQQRQLNLSRPQLSTSAIARILVHGWRRSAVIRARHDAARPRAERRGGLAAEGTRRTAYPGRPACTPRAGRRNGAATWPGLRHSTRQRGVLGSRPCPGDSAWLCSSRSSLLAARRWPIRRPLRRPAGRHPRQARHPRQPPVDRPEAARRRPRRPVLVRRPIPPPRRHSS